MSVVYGFGGMRIRDGLLSFEPRLPDIWNGLSFKILYRGRTLKAAIGKEHLTIENLQGEGLDIYMAGSKKHLDEGGKAVVDI